MNSNTHDKASADMIFREYNLDIFMRPVYINEIGKTYSGLSQNYVALLEGNWHTKKRP